MMSIIMMHAIDGQQTPRPLHSDRHPDTPSACHRARSSQGQGCAGGRCFPVERRRAARLAAGKRAAVLDLRCATASR
ncbi:hypothetical protein [Xanthobacter autotrophicus]|uniref:hypothetical protein n=1 Tax=Xanthobacter autotrophicus TaxID=280 RepID=UPI00372870DB